MSIGVLASCIAVASFAAVMIYSAISDVLTMTVSDRLVLALAVAFPVLAPMSDWSMERIGFAMAAALVAFFISVALFALGWIGGGDGKLLTVTVLWLGSEQVLDFMVLASLVGALCAICLLLFRKVSVPEGWLRKEWIARLHRPETGVPYAVAIGMAALLLLPQTPWLQQVGLSFGLPN